MRHVHNTQASGQPPRLRLGWFGALLAAPMAAVLWGGALRAEPVSTASQETAEEGTDVRALIESTRVSQEQWVELRKIITAEEVQLEESKQYLTDQIELVQQQIDAAREGIESTQSRITETVTKRQELEARNSELEAARASLVAAIDGLEERTLALRPRLPMPLQDDLDLIYQRFPLGDDKAKQATLSTRYGNVLAVLTISDKFNTSVHITSERRKTGEGDDEVLASVLYLGVGQAFYVSPDAAYAGRGIPGDDGWEWTPMNELGPEIARAVAMFNGAGEPAAFVQLPTEIR